MSESDFSMAHYVQLEITSLREENTKLLIENESLATRLKDAQTQVEMLRAQLLSVAHQVSTLKSKYEHIRGDQDIYLENYLRRHGGS